MATTVEIAYVQDLMRIRVRDVETKDMLWHVTVMARSVANILELEGIFEITIAGIPDKLTLSVTADQVMLSTMKEQPVLLTKTDLIRSLTQGGVYGEERQNMESADPQHRPEEGCDLNTGQ